MAHKKATYALLVDHFKLTKREIRKLTDRQIAELYFHPRTKEGAIKVEKANESRPLIVPENTPSPKAVVPVPAASNLERDLRDLAVIASALKLNPQNVAEARAKIHAKYAQGTEGKGTEGQ